MKHIHILFLVLLGLPTLVFGQVTLRCPSACRPIMSCNACWESVQQAIDNGCTITSIEAKSVFEAASLLEVYPNPSESRFVIENKSHLSGKAEIMDQAGRLVATFQLNGESNYVVDAQLASGLYLLRLVQEDNKGSSNKKLVVK